MWRMIYGMAKRADDMWRELNPGMARCWMMADLMWHQHRRERAELHITRWGQELWRRCEQGGEVCSNEGAVE